MMAAPSLLALCAPSQRFFRSSDIQCRYHYMRQQNSRACSWTLEEEESLKNLVAKHEAETPECWVLVRGITHYFPV
jgi:hypothetical protein